MLSLNSALNQPSLYTFQPPPRSPNPNHLRTPRNRKTGFLSARCRATKTAHSLIVTDSRSESCSFPVVNFRSVALWLRSCRTRNDVRMVHAVTVKNLEASGRYVCNRLIIVYSVMGGVLDARNVFDRMRNRNVVSWTAMIDAYIGSGLDDEAMRLFGLCVDSGVVGNSRTLVCMLKLCGKMLDFELGRQIHACVVKRGYKNLVVDSAVVYFYAQCGDFESAYTAFGLAEERDFVCWTGLITACARQRRGREALELLSCMLEEGYSLNEFAVCGALKACGDENELKFGRQLHGAVVKTVCKRDVYVETCLVDMYAKCGEIPDSRAVFNGMPYKNTASWTAIIAGYARMGLGEEALRLFRVMNRENIMSHHVTIISVLRACGSIGALLAAREVHGQVIRNCATNDCLETTLLWLYCKCGKSSVASRIFRQMPTRDIVSWTAIISGYAGLGHESEALRFLTEMVEEGINPNEFTCSSALKACASLESVASGKSIHSVASKNLATSNVYVNSALIHMYAKCGYVSEATRIFNDMPERNLVTWSTMIYGYTRNGLSHEALKLIYRLRAEAIEVGEHVHATVFNTCGSIDSGGDLLPDASNPVGSTDV